MRTIEQIQSDPQITRFNRHESMDSETRSLILDTIKEVGNLPLGSSSYVMKNWLYGLFDGYDYSEFAISSHELASITSVDVELSCKISHIFSIIEKYPRV